MLPGDGVPAQTAAADTGDEARRHFLSNGPGDPAATGAYCGAGDLAS